MTIESALDPKRNALNALRLGLAALVLVWHSFPLTGHRVDLWPAHQLLGNISVDTFFAISGFLITQSWVRRPSWQPFVAARALRIVPAFWAALLLTVLVVAPLGTWVARGQLPVGFWVSAGAYVVNNLALMVTQYGITGTPLDVPYPGVWNGSAWTLFWEALCYVGVLALGLARLIERRWAIPVAFGVSWLGLLVSAYGPVDNYWFSTASRFGVMFLAGAMVYRFGAAIPVRRSWLLVASVVLVASTWLPDYRIVACLPIAYLAISVGALGRSPRLRFGNDFSYGMYIYAFPLQQLVASFGGWRWGVPGFALASLAITLPVATASWFWLERPAMRLKHHRVARTVEDVATR